MGGPAEAGRSVSGGGRFVSGGGRSVNIESTELVGPNAPNWEQRSVSRLKSCEHRVYRTCRFTITIIRPSPPGCVRCVRCVSRLPSTKSVRENRCFPLTALELRAPGARRLELVRTFLVGSRSRYPTLPPTDHRPISDRGAAVRPDLGRGLPLWGVRPRRAGLCHEAWGGSVCGL